MMTQMGRMEDWGGREAQERRDICVYIIYMADSRCCTAESNTPLERNYIPIKTKPE